MHVVLQKKKVDLTHRKAEKFSYLDWEKEGTNYLNSGQTFYFSFTFFDIFTKEKKK